MKWIPVIALAVVLARGAGAAVPGVPTMYATYDQDCTLTLMVDPGTQITATSAPTLPPGKYDLMTYMPNPSSGYSCGKPPSFSLTGPGVNVLIPFPGQALSDERLITLQPSSTYVADDTNAPATTQRTFTTAATGSSASLVQPPPSTGTGKGSTQPDIVGSDILPYRGRLVASVVKGKTKLMLRGRSVVTLEAGKYQVVDGHGTVFLRHGKAKPAAVKSGARIALSSGRWTLYARGTKPAQLVVSA